MSKKKDNTTKNYLNKKKLLEKYNKFYYDKDSPVVSDQS
jgi:NAD-dependent DNA ligase